MNYSEILKSVAVTEKALSNMKKENKYTFIVTKSATKGQVRGAVEALYKVKVIAVNTLQNRGRIKHSLVKRRSQYVSADVKKAIVQLDPKDSLKIYDGGKE